MPHNVLRLREIHQSSRNFLAKNGIKNNKYGLLRYEIPDTEPLREQTNEHAQNVLINLQRVLTVGIFFLILKY